jgi:chromate reductase
MTKKTGKLHPKKIAVLVGSLSQESTSKNLAKYFIAVAPKSLELEVIEIGKLSLYNEDLDDKPPTEWTLFRDQMKTYDGFLFITPEMNGSFSGSLKNAIDIASSPYNQNIFNEKPGAVVSVSAGAAERNGANPHLRQSLIFFESANHATT